MKKIYIIAGLLFLASCGQAEIEQTTVTELPVTSDTVIEQVAEEIDDEVSALETATEDVSKTVTLDGEYTNPKGLVDMSIVYATDADGVITDMNVTATTYDLSEFNNEVQTLVGSTLEDAAEFSSSSSLTNSAFKTAIKSQL